jgi:hypothetical protein
MPRRHKLANSHATGNNENSNYRGHRKVVVGEGYYFLYFLSKCNKVTAGWPSRLLLPPWRVSEDHVLIYRLPRCSSSSCVWYWDGLSFFLLVPGESKPSLSEGLGLFVLPSVRGVGCRICCCCAGLDPGEVKLREHAPPLVCLNAQSLA